MFQSSPYATTVGSKSTIVPSDHQQDYRDGETMRFKDLEGTNSDLEHKNNFAFPTDITQEPS